ncbi:MAG: hypothetical protein M1829_002272 [Trizodia sp. TS-e1964]|nr:MAG: hypothetical protein M1829_002272 [Trizodia sp. TS-e1964]
MSFKWSFTFLISIALLFQCITAHPKFVGEPTTKLFPRGQKDKDLSATLPQIEGATNLPPPSSNLTIRAVVLGRGTQNYTCNGYATSAAPLAIGAEASLYDARKLLDTPSLFNSLPGFSVHLEIPDESKRFVAKYALTRIGQHYFASDGSPIFDLTVGRENLGFLRAKRVANVPAPACAPKGQGGEGAIDWLFLDDKGGSQGLSAVYRVETAGGKAPATCDGMPAFFEVQYAAQYWFYG